MVDGFVVPRAATRKPPGSKPYEGMDLKGRQVQELSKRAHAFRDGETRMSASVPMILKCVAHLEGVL